MGETARVRRGRLLLVMGSLIAVAGVVAACAPPPKLVDLPEVSGPIVQAQAPDTAGPLRIRGGDLVDAEGRIVLIHGINSVRKEAPYISPLESGWLGETELAYIRNSGFNGVRLGVSYAALMPQAGVIAAEYLDKVVDTVDVLEEQGLWVQLDFHQDLFHMMPDWATPADAVDLSDETPAYATIVGWAGQYMSEKSIRQWTSFVKGEPIIDGRSVASVLGDAAAALAERVVDHANVIGIELLNEPFPGDPAIQCILEGCRSRERHLSERYAEIGAPVRAVAPQMPIWIEPFAPTGYAAFPAVPAPEIPATSDGAQIGLAWHLYCKDTDGGEPVESESVMTELCTNRMKNGFAAGRSQAKVLGAAEGVAVPKMLNEFGASWDPLDVTLVAPLADKEFTSWMFWHMYRATSPYDSVIPNVVESQIIRPYPQATAGTPGKLAYEPASGAFSFSYTPDPSIDAPTSIVVPARAYPTGYDVTVVGGSVTSTEQSGMLTVVPDGSGTQVTVTLARR